MTSASWTGQVYEHDFSHDWLRLDIDLTALLASQWVEGSEKGYFPQKKRDRTTISPSSRH